MEIEMGRCLAVNDLEKPNPLLVPMLIHALGDDLPLEQFQCGKQGCRPVALVVVRHGLRATLVYRQALWGAVEGLNLGLLVDAENEYLFGRVEVQAHNIHGLLDELRIIAELESLDQVRLKTTGFPYPTDHEVVHAEFFRQTASAPMGGIARTLLRRPQNLRFDSTPNQGLPSAPRRVLLDAAKAELQKRVRHRPTLSRVTLSSFAISRFSYPCAASKTTFARRIKRAWVLFPRTQRSDVAFCSSVSSTRGAIRISSHSPLQRLTTSPTQ